MHTQVLIIGGFAGASTSQTLSKLGVENILIDRKDYFEVTFATLRNAAAPALTGNRARKKYSDFIRATFVQGDVSQLYADRAELDDGRVLSFERVVIASGTRYPSLSLAKSAQMTSLEARNREFADLHRQLVDASSVLILGGGTVGVELAGEVAAAHPDTLVTLAHGAAHLLPGFKPKMQHTALAQLRALGVEVALNTRYALKDEHYLNTETGEAASADVILPATGTVPNNDFLQPQMSHILDAQGFVKVDHGLEVVAQPRFYALGDIADVGEAKLGYLAQQQGEYLGKRIARSLRGKAVKAYRRNPLMALIPTGQRSGVVQLPFAVTTWQMLVNMKQKDLFITKTYKGLGAK
ncbi:MAG: NAD(P)/FAD-dependent oxidoreductase [Pseudomonadales bacterium]